MAGRRRGRTGRGWDAAPPRVGSAPRTGPDQGSANDSADDDPRALNDVGQPDPGGGAGSSGRSRGRTAWDPRSRGGTAWDPRSRGGSTAEPSGIEAPVDPAERAREICLRLLAFRPRTRAELATALRQRGISDEVAAEVLERYGEVGIIDDRAFARAWVTSRHHGRGLARKALAGELRRKGVDSEAVGAALEELDPATEAETARALVERRLRTDRGGQPEAVFRRLVGMLARKGYPAGLAIRVVKEALEDRVDPGELEAVELESFDQTT